jgi:hypothetical protein
MRILFITRQDNNVFDMTANADDKEFAQSMILPYAKFLSGNQFAITLQGANESYKAAESIVKLSETYAKNSPYAGSIGVNYTVTHEWRDDPVQPVKPVPTPAPAPVPVQPAKPVPAGSSGSGISPVMIGGFALAAFAIWKIFLAKK